MIGFAAVIGLHIFILYALVSGLARNVVEIVKKPLETKIIVELPPPPPPPKEIAKPQPAIKSDATPPPAFVPPPELTPPHAATALLQAADATPPAAPVEVQPPVDIAPVPPAQPERLTVEGSCPGYADVLRHAFNGLYDKHEVAGTATVRVQVRGSAITQVSVLTGPREYHRAVTAAVGRLNCQVSGSAEGYFDLPIVFRE